MPSTSPSCTADRPSGGVPWSGDTGGGTGHGLGGLPEARLNLLRTLDLPASNRDPLSEFAEQFVAALTDCTLAPSRVQTGWDVALRDGAKVQVRYLANTSGGGWVNEHLVRRIADVDWYALVIIEDFGVSGVAMFPCTGLAVVAFALGKRHGDTENTLQFTRLNWLAIRGEPDRFRALGVRVLLPPWCTPNRTS
ncbi:hypothetical protein [Nocardioides furvisabuli]|uniref:Uncharacterized protein n=1 Tax=Nocardioides furvisabuli TaxID=375542 RepID=A0ABP5JBA0_9ACTN|nr:hypothetical protein [Nocardioides furvisabuli]